ncbi:hypothetical protein C2G38_2217930 [Gigaspora rosea]|uniref:CCHC-type domain-containing protein n=1 Tax=Gigaspora rosea TaxID=44941 RepID=A0A397U777_9GLOM|nr:hypothetical protein C2G38_2217930 [Gigaspora rosea]
MSNSHKTARVQSQFLSTYIQPYSPHAKNDSDSCKDEKQLLPRSKCTTPEPFINNDSYKQSQQSHSLKHFPSQSYLQITPRNNESSHASKNSRRSPEPRCCICNQAGHYRSDCPQLNNQSHQQSQFNQQFQQSQQPSFNQSLVTNYSINTYKNHQDCSYSSKDKYLTPEPNTNNNILYHHQYSHIDYPHFNQSYQISQPNQQLQQSQQLSDSSKNKRITPEQNINNGIQHWQYIQTKDYSQLNYLPSQESQHSLIFSPSDHMKQNYSKNTQKNHQNQSYSLKNKRTTSEPNINQRYQKSQPNNQIQKSQQSFSNKSKNKREQNNNNNNNNNNKNDNRNHKREQTGHVKKKDQQQLKNQSYQKSQQSQQISPNQTVIVNIMPKQEQARDGFFSRILRKKSDLNKEK